MTCKSGMPSEAAKSRGLGLAEAAPGGILRLALANLYQVRPRNLGLVAQGNLLTASREARGLQGGLRFEAWVVSLLWGLGALALLFHSS